MNKRGQFFIIMAVVIASVVFALSTRVNKFEQEIPVADFAGLANNYIVEVPKLIDYSIYNKQQDISLNLLRDFTNNFLSYARTKNSNLGLVYVYGDDKNNKTVIENYLPSGSIVVYNTSDNNKNQLFPADENIINGVILNISGQEFRHDVPVRLRTFSNEYYSDTTPATEWIKLDIGNTPFFFTLPNTVDFGVIIKTSSEKTNLPSNDVICTYNAALNTWGGSCG